MAKLAKFHLISREGAIHFELQEPRNSKTLKQRFMEAILKDQLHVGALPSRIRDGLFSLLTSLAIDSGFSPFITYFELTIIFAQELSFSLSSAFPWNTSVLSWLSNILKYFRLQLNSVMPSTSLMILVTYLFLGMGLLNIFLFAFLVWNYTNTRVIAKNLLWKWVRFLSATMTGFLYIPIFSMGGYYLMGRYAKNELSGLGNITNDFIFGCSSTFETVIFVLILCVIFLFCILHETSVFQWDPMSTAITCRTDSRAMATMTLFRGITSFVFALVEPYRTQQAYFLLGGLLLVHHGTALAIFWHDIPFYSWKVNKLYVCYYGVSFWGSLCALLSIVINNREDTGPVWMFYSGVLLCVPTCMFAVTSRIDSISKKSQADLSSGTEVDIKVRILQQDIRKEWEKNRMEEKRTLEESHFQPIDDIFTNCEERFPDSAKFFFSWSTHAMSFKQNRCLAMAKLRVILDSNHFYDDLVAAHTRLHYIAVITSGEQLDKEMDVYVARRKLEAQVLKQFLNCVKGRLKFWKRLTLQTMDPKDIQQLAQEMEASFQVTKELTEKLVKGNPSSPQYRLFYGKFLSDLAYDEAEATAQARRAAELETEVKDLHSMDMNIGSSDYAVIVISGEKSTMGRILDANQKALQTFGYILPDLLGRKVNVLMPKPYAENHDDRLHEFIYRSSGKISKKKQLTMMNSRGFIFHGQLQVREYAKFTLEPTIAFIGVVTVQDIEKPFILVSTDKHQVLNVSASVAKIFEINMVELRNGDVFMDRWIPAYNSIVTTVLDILGEDSDASYDVSLTPDHHRSYYRTKLSFTFTYTPYLGQTYFTIFVGSEWNRRLTGLGEGSSSFRPNLLKGGGVLKVATSGTSVESSTTPRDSRVRRGSSGLVVGSDIPTEASRNLLNEKSSVALVAGSKQDQQSEDIKSHGGEMMNNVATKFEILQLLKATLEKHLNNLDPHFQRILRWWVIMILGLSALTILQQIIWEAYVINATEMLLDWTMHLGDFRWASLTCEYSALIFSLLKSGYLGDTVLEWQHLQNDLQKVISMSSQLSQEIYLKKKDLSADHWQWLMSPNIQFYVMDNSTTKVNFVQALQTIELTASMIVNTTFEEVVRDPKHMTFFQYNTNDSIFHVINSTIQIIQETQNENIMRMNSISLYIFVLGLILLVVITFMIILPSFLSSERIKGNVLHIFDMIPIPLIQTKVSSYSDKLASMGGNDDTLEKTAIAEVFETKKKQRKKKKKSSRLLSDRLSQSKGRESTLSVSNKKALEAEKSSDIQPTSEAPVEHDAEEKVEVQEPRLHTGNVEMLLHPLLLFMVVVLIVVVGYFVGIYLWWSLYQQPVLEDIALRLNAVTYRTFLVRNIVKSFLQISQEQKSSPSFLSQMSFLVQSEDELWETEHVSLYGTGEGATTSGSEWNGLMSSISILPLSENYMFSDMCFVVDQECDLSCQLQGNHTCQNFSNGILTQGIHESILYFLLQSQFLRSTLTMSKYPTTAAFPQLQNASAMTLGPFNTGSFQSKVLDLKFMADTLLPPGLFGIEQMIRLEFDNHFIWITLVLRSMCASLVVFLWLTFLFGIRPFIKKCDQALKQTRSLLTILPAEWMQEQESLWTETYHFIKRDFFSVVPGKA